MLLLAGRQVVKALDFFDMLKMQNHHAQNFNGSFRRGMAPAVKVNNIVILARRMILTFDIPDFLCASLAAGITMPRKRAFRFRRTATTSGKNCRITR